jgi:hypothetical protein
VSTRVANVFKSIPSTSCCAKALDVGSRFLILLARRLNNTAAFVSGNVTNGIAVHPATIEPIQNVHRHPIEGAQKPLMIGAKSGPPRVVTMKRAMLRPRSCGVGKISAKIPAATAMGAEAKMPVKSRKMRKEAQERARAVEMVKRVNSAKAHRVRRRRPYCSDKGAQKIGPEGG